MTGATNLVIDQIDLWTSAIETKSRAGRGGVSKVSFYGVQQLRNLILNLAVNGNLSRRDPGDEPVPHQLKRISKGKEDLVYSNTIKKPRRVDSEFSVGITFRIPEYWKVVRMDSVGAIIGGGTPTAHALDNFETPGAGIPWLTPADLSNHTGRYISRGTRDLSIDGLKSSSATLMPEGTVLFTSRAPIGYVAIASNEIATNQGFKSIVPYIPELSPYLSLVLRFLTPEINRVAPGTTFKEVSGKFVASLPVPIPPIEEQSRIIAMVDELMALCDALEQQSKDSLDAHQALVETLFSTLTSSESSEEFSVNWRRISENFDTLLATEESIEVFKRTVLELAVLGRLTVPESEEASADDLLEQVAARRLEEVAAGRIRKEKPLSKINDGECPFPIPRPWSWAKIGQIALFTQYGTSTKAGENPKGIPVLAMGNIQNGEVVGSSSKRLPLDSDELPDLFLKKNDLLYNRTNSAELVGKTGIFRGEDDSATFASYLIRIRVPHELVSAEYVNLAMNALYFRQTQIVPHIRKQTGQANVNGTIMRNMLIPLPPLAEQYRIVSRVSSLIQVCDQIGEQIAEASKLKTKLADITIKIMAA
ncbi:MAG: restriction endonuclease subunit S [Kiloniellales bacterium]